VAVGDSVSLSTTKDDVEWVRDQIRLNGLHMHDNVLENRKKESEKNRDNQKDKNLCCGVQLNGLVVPSHFYFSLEELESGEIVGN